MAVGMGHPGDFGLPPDDLAHGGHRNRVFLAIGFETDQRPRVGRDGCRLDHGGSGFRGNSLHRTRDPRRHPPQHPVQIQQRNRRLVPAARHGAGVKPAAFIRPLDPLRRYVDHARDAIDLKPDPRAAAQDDDPRPGLIGSSRRQAQHPPHVDQHGDGAAQVDQAFDGRRAQGNRQNVRPPDDLADVLERQGGADLADPENQMLPMPGRFRQRRFGVKRRCR